VIAAPPPVSLAVSPPRIVLAAGETQELHVLNSGSRAAVVTVGAAGYTVSFRGDPQILARTAALSIRPRTLAIPAGATAAVAVSSATAAPADRTAVVLLTSSPGGRGIGVSVRVGVLVVLRGAGGLVHRVVPLAVRRRGRRLELLLRNDGNAVEAVTRAAVRVDLLQRRRVVGRATAEPRELLPRTRGVSLLRLRTRARGLVSARVEVRVGRSTVRKAFRIRLPR
jgi:hypothetical protein